jgi:hypothetical protein
MVQEIKGFVFEILGKIKSGHFKSRDSCRWRTVHSHLHVITSVDGEKRKYMLGSPNSNLKEITFLRENMCAIDSYFFEGMETQRAALKLCGLSCPAKG